jgi:hypothetical protein
MTAKYDDTLSKTANVQVVRGVKVRSRMLSEEEAREFLAGKRPEGKDAFAETATA